MNGEKRNAYRLFVGKPEGKRPLGDQHIGGWMILGWILERWDGVMWTGLVWLRIGISGKLMWIQYWTFGFHKMLGNYRVDSQLVASRVVLSSIELVKQGKYALVALWGGMLNKGVNW
jgi:hypothetical protein